MKHSGRLLLLEDDAVLLETLHDELTRCGYEVYVAKHGEAALTESAARRYDLYILDINVPYIDGLSLLDSLRQSGDTTPAIFLTSRRGEADTIAGFAHGCDDYLTKPFSLGELKARIAALLRRTGGGMLLRHDDIELDLAHHILRIGGKEVALSHKEMEILHLFLSHPGRLFSTDEIIERLYRDTLPSTTVIRVHISKINALFPEKRIVNVRGAGYRYVS